MKNSHCCCSYPCNSVIPDNWKLAADLYNILTHCVCCMYVCMYLCFDLCLLILIFDHCVCCSLIEQGFQEGTRAGNISGYEKGFALGVKHGAEINKEVLTL